MDNSLRIKLRYIFLRYLIFSLAFVLIYSFLAWLLFYRNNVFNLYEEVVAFLLPYILSFIIVAFGLDREIKLLDVKGKRENGYFLYKFFIAFLLAITLFAALQYVESTVSTAKEVDNVYEITNPEDFDCYKINSFVVHKELVETSSTSMNSGTRFNDKLTFYIYFATPIADSSETVDILNHKYWCGINYSETHNKPWKSEKKLALWREFEKNGKSYYRKFYFKGFKYFEVVPESATKYYYISAIKSAKNKVPEEELVILKPVDEPISKKASNRLDWAIGVYIFTSLIVLLMILFPSLNYKKFKKYLDGAEYNDDFKPVYKLHIIPRGQHYVYVILIYINIAVFFANLFLNRFFPDIHLNLVDLLSFSRNEVLRGEVWRIFTYMFLETSIINLLWYNFILSYTGFFLEPLIGRKKFLILYFISGIGAIVYAGLLHNNQDLISGSEGAIFGVIGAMFVMLANWRVEKNVANFLIAIFIYGGITVYLGMTGALDTTLYLGGILAGMIVALFFLLSEENKMYK